MQPRTADLTHKGEWASSLDWAGYTLAPGEVDTVAGDHVDGVYGMRHFPHPMVAFMMLPFLSGVAQVSAGVSDRMELSGILGIQELGAEVRYALLDEDSGDRVSLSASSAVVYRPLQVRGSDVKFARYPGARAGLELSHRGKKVTPFADLAVSFAPENYGQLLPERLSPDCGSFGEEGCGEYGPPRQFLISRDEVRLTGGFGLSFENGSRNPYKDSSGAFHLALVPYVTLWSGKERMTCMGCSFANPDDFDSRWGVTLAGGYRFH